MNVAHAIEGKTVNQSLIDLANVLLAEMEKKGILLKSKVYGHTPYFRLVDK